jgi:hypothetical protein
VCFIRDRLTREQVVVPQHHERHRTSNKRSTDLAVATGALTLHRGGRVVGMRVRTRRAARRRNDLRAPTCLKLAAKTLDGLLEHSDSSIGMPHRCRARVVISQSQHKLLETI